MFEMIMFEMIMVITSFFHAFRAVFTTLHLLSNGDTNFYTGTRGGGHIINLFNLDTQWPEKVSELESGSSKPVVQCVLFFITLL